MEQNNDNQDTSVNSQTAAPQPTQDQNQPAQAQQPAAQAPAVSNAPDRTREQFEKLLESNKKLYEANVLLRQEMEQQRTRPTPQPQPRQVQSEVNPNDFVERDPITGEAYINEKRLRARIEEIQDRAVKAEQTIQSYMKSSEDREIERQNQEAFAAFPELEPGSQNFDATFHKQVRGILADSMFNPDEYSGRPLSFREAAEFVKAQYPKAQPAADATAEAEQQAQSQAAQQQKEQASSQAQSQPRGAQSQTDEEELESLRYRTRYQNDDWALAQRIKHTEHILPKNAEEVSQ